MNSKADGFAFLTQLREQNGKEQQSFRAFTRYLDQKAREKGIPIRGQFELTPLCNLSCKMCYVHLSQDQMAGRSILPASAWKEIIRQAWQAGMYQVALTGGECLAYPGFDELYQYVQGLGCEVSILTNGVLLDEKRIRFFTEHSPALIKITLYGWNDDVYERVTGKRVFGIVSENIRNAVDSGLPVKISVTPSSFLGEDVLQTISLAKSLCEYLDINCAVFPPREETGRSGQHDDPDTGLYVKAYQLQSQLEGRTIQEIPEELLPDTGGKKHECAECGLQCGGGRSGFVVNWQGIMMPCDCLDMIRGYPLQEGFSKAWNRINKGAESWPRIPECESCVYRYVCNHCAANMLRFAKPGELSTELCERTKTFVQYGVCPLPDCE